MSCFSQHKLHSIQNTLACIVTNHRKYAYVTPILKQLHWLPVHHRHMFKTATLLYKSLHSSSPSYFVPPLSLSSCSYSARHSHLDHQYLTIPPFQSPLYKSVKHFGYSFASVVPKIWNDLPNYIHIATSIASIGLKVQNLAVCKSLCAVASMSLLCLLGMTWLCYWNFSDWFCSICLRVCHLIKIKCYKSPH